MVLKLSYYIAEMCTILLDNFGDTIVFHFSIIRDSFQKTLSDFGHFEQLCEKNSCHTVLRLYKTYLLPIWDIFYDDCTEREN